MNLELLWSVEKIFSFLLICLFTNQIISEMLRKYQEFVNSLKSDTTYVEDLDFEG